ncbi:hypothetical protein JCM5296_003785 [Sporobolomyces johnsonii]
MAILFSAIAPSYVPKQPDQSNPLATLVGVVIESILEVFFLCLVGWVLAKQGIVDDKAKKTLNKINTSLFTPCLLFNKVAFSLTPATLAELYIIPIGFCLVSTFSALVAYLLGRVLRLKKGQRNFAIACATFQNSNSLPIALIQSLVGEKLPLAWGPHDTRDAMLGRALSYLVLFSTLGIVIRWSVGVRLLTSAETEQEPEVDPLDEEEAREESSESNTLRAEGEDYDSVAGDEDVDEAAAAASEADALLASHARATQKVHKTRSILRLPGSDSSPTATTPRHQRERTSSTSSPSKLVVLPSTDIPGSSDQPLTQSQSRASLRQLRKKRARIFQSFPNTPIPSVYSSSRANSVYADGDEDEDEDGDEDGEMSEFGDADDREWGARRGVGRKWLGEKGPVWRAGKALRRRVWRPVRKVAKKVGDFMTVPLWAALLSLFVACVPPVQNLLNQAEPLKAAIRSSGSCSVPITLVTLGAYFYRPSEPATTSPLRPSDEPAAMNPNPSAIAPQTPQAEGSFSSALLARLRRPFAPLPARPASSSAEGKRPHGGETRTVFVAVVSRMIIVPLVLVPLFGWYAAKTVNVADDPVFVVVACLLIGSPTAITLAQITSSAAGPTFEKLISRTLFVSYAFLTAPTTIALVLAALYIDKMQ